MSFFGGIFNKIETNYNSKDFSTASDSKMRHFSSDSYSGKYYQNPDFWYELETMKLLKKNVVWDFSKKIKTTNNRLNTLWISDSSGSNRVEIEGIKMKYSGDPEIIHDTRLNRALGKYTDIYCPESDQTLELNGKNLLQFCLFLREEEEERELMAKMEREEIIKNNKLEEYEKKKQILREKHNIATAYATERLNNTAITDEIDAMPLELKKDYDNYIKVLETIRLSKEQGGI